MNVEESEIQQLNKYTIETAENIGREDYSLVGKKAGTQTLEGVQAVSYGRIRKGVGDDFKRTERMRTVITLVMEKMKGMSFGELKDIIDMMTPQVQTNLSMGNILGLAIRLPQYNIIGTDGWPYNVSTGYISGTSYVFPSDLAANVIELHQKFFAQDDYTPSSMVYSISSQIAQRIEAERNAGNIENEQEERDQSSQGSASSGGNTGTGDGSNTGTGVGRNAGTGDGGNTGTGDGGNTGTGDGGNTGAGDGGNTGTGDGGNTGTGDGGDTGPETAATPGPETAVIPGPETAATPEAETVATPEAETAAAPGPETVAARNRWNRRQCLKEPEYNRSPG